MDANTITTIKVLQEKLRTNEVKFRFLYEALPVAFFTTDQNGICQVVNSTFLAMVKEPYNSILEKPWFHWVHADYQQTVVDRWHEAVRLRKHWQEEFKIVNSGGEERWVRLLFRSMISDTGVTHVGVMDDITGQRKAEEKRFHLEQELNQAHRLESIGTLAAGIAHEINTPVQFISDNVQFLANAITDMQGLLAQYKKLSECLSRPATLPAVMTAVKKAEEKADLSFLAAEIPNAVAQTFDGIKRVTAIVNAMKDFSHIGQEEKQPADINKGIESTVTVCRNEWKYVSDLELDLSPSLPLVLCVASDINQVVMNLIINATHTIKDKVDKGLLAKGLITVTTAALPDGVSITVRDNGMGIPAGLKDRIFEPFFTTKAVGKGTGQGLSIAYQTIVTKHGGKLYYDSKAGEGTVFFVELPVTGGTGQDANADDRVG